MGWMVAEVIFEAVNTLTWLLKGPREDETAAGVDFELVLSEEGSC